MAGQRLTPIPPTSIVSGQSDKTACWVRLAKRVAPEGAVFLALVFALLAFEDELLPSGDIGNPLGLAFAEFGFACGGIDLGPIADAEVDVVQSLRQSLEVLLRGVVARPHVEVHDDAGVTLDAFHVDEDDVFLTDFDGLGSELHIADVARIEVQGSDIINIVDLREINISHGALKVKRLLAGYFPTYELGVGVREVYLSHVQILLSFLIYCSLVYPGVSSRKRAYPGACL